MFFFFFCGVFLQFRSECAYERACRLSAAKVWRSFKDDIPWMFPAAVWAYACHGKLSHLVVSFLFFYSQRPVFSLNTENCVFVIRLSWQNFKAHWRFQFEGENSAVVLLKCLSNKTSLNREKHMLDHNRGLVKFETEPPKRAQKRRTPYNLFVSLWHCSLSQCIFVKYICVYPVQQVHICVLASACMRARLYMKSCLVLWKYFSNAPFQCRVCISEPLNLL